MKKIALFLLIFAGAAVYAEIEHPMDAMLKTWYDTPIKEVVKYWGNATDIDYKRNQTVYSWEESTERYIPGTQFQRKLECERKLIVDISGKVIFGTFEGNGCPFTAEGAKKWAKPLK